MRTLPSIGSLWRSWKRWRRRAFLSAAILAVAFCQAAHAVPIRIVALRWLDPNPSPSPVVGFVVHYGAQSGVYQMAWHIGLPPQDENLEYHFGLPVGAYRSVHVALTAQDIEGRSSGLSNEKYYPVPEPSRAAMLGAGLLALWMAAVVPPRLKRARVLGRAGE